ncbi:unnamed protein product [Medioppia subpectinata]|uniref:NR LBD domain-containing protein n=1 Tax=Medioppia subpectinata TaxID=1979941 RepID=A0A7R9KDF0_9ACAR|nr:unnamed protein product [Medioppia subpectinata]CAG2101228.1 unnamed protein product [Medioppia subpectinata]
MCSTNFGALTCEPCRQFFRRNANKIQDFGLFCSFKEREDMGRFKQLFSFMNEIKDPVVRCTSNCTTYTDYIRITETWNELKYKQFVKMATNITEFNDLCAEDKVSLLKTGLSELMALTTVLRFDFEGEFWRVPILTAILLFNPNVQNLMNRDIIRLQRKTYMYLLQRYLEIKHNSKSESETRFGRLMNCLQDLYVVSPLSVKNYIEFNTTAKNPGPLMKELYNV